MGPWLVSVGVVELAEAALGLGILVGFFATDDL